MEGRAGGRMMDERRRKKKVEEKRSHGRIAGVGLNERIGLTGIRIAYRVMKLQSSKEM